ncbi:hypothetical protein FBZ84_11981 [Azospirillum baldaniorum]|nr:hypothetical protein FBZ84_11981 [Azospirillum baldaniorum]
MLKAVRSDCGQVSAGPRGVAVQSWVRTHWPMMPPPGKPSAALTSCPPWRRPGVARNCPLMHFPGWFVVIGCRSTPGRRGRGANHEAAIGRRIVDSIGDRLTDGILRALLHQNAFGRPAPSTAGVFVVDDQLTFFTSSLMMGPPAAWKCASRSRGECRASVRRALPFGRKPNRRTRHAIVGRLAGYPATAKAALRCCRQRRLASARRPAGLPARQRGEPRAWTTEDIGNSRHRRRNKPSIPPTRGLAKWFLGVPQPAVFLDLDMIAASWAVWLIRALRPSYRSALPRSPRRRPLWGRG